MSTVPAYEQLHQIVADLRSGDDPDPLYIRLGKIANLVQNQSVDLDRAHALTDVIWHFLRCKLGPEWHSPDSCLEPEELTHALNLLVNTNRKASPLLSPETCDVLGKTFQSVDAWKHQSTDRTCLLAAIDQFKDALGDTCLPTPATVALFQLLTEAEHVRKGTDTPRPVTEEDASRLLNEAAQRSSRLAAATMANIQLGANLSGPALSLDELRKNNGFLDRLLTSMEQRDRAKLAIEQARADTDKLINEAKARIRKALHDCQNQIDGLAESIEQTAGAIELDSWAEFNEHTNTLTLQASDAIAALRKVTDLSAPPEISTTTESYPHEQLKAEPMSNYSHSFSYSGDSAAEQVVDAELDPTFLRRAAVIDRTRVRSCELEMAMLELPWWAIAARRYLIERLHRLGEMEVKLMQQQATG